MSQLKLTRRDFLKITGATAIGTAILIEAPPVIDKIFNAVSNDVNYTLNYPSDEIVYTNCFQCLGRCAIEVVRTPEGFPRFVTGTIGWHINDGGVCPRGASDVYYYFAPARLRYPLLRAGPRGSGKWIAIDYDTAFDIIVNGASAQSWSKLGLNPSQLGIGNFEGLLKIRETNPHALAYFQGRDQLVPGIDAGFFAGNFGTANSGAHGGFCSMNVYTAGVYVTGAPVWEYAGPDEERAQYFILAGLAGDHFPNWMRRIIARIRENGGKVVTIAPERFGFYSVSDEHLYVNPGTDGALAMGWIRVLVDFHYYVYKVSQGQKVLNPITLQPVSPAYDPTTGQLWMQTVAPNGQVVQLPQFGDIPSTANIPHIDEEFLRYYTNLSWLVIVNPNPQNGDCLDPSDPTAQNNVGLHVRMPVSNPLYAKSQKVSATTSTGKTVSITFPANTWLEAIMGNDGNVYAYVDIPWQKGVMPILTLDELPQGILSNIVQVPYKLKNGQTVKVPAIKVTVPVAPNSNETITLTVTTAFELLRAELMNYDPYTPYTQPAQYGALNVANVTGIPHNTIVRIANELAVVAFQKAINQPAKWVDYLGRYHDYVIGRPVSIYFMRGIAAHANGFMSASSYYYLVLMLGAWDNPGATEYKYPYPHYFPGHSVPPHPLANTPSIDPALSNVKPQASGRAGFLKTEYIHNDGTVEIADVKVVSAGPYGYPDGPDDLVIYKTGRPLLVDRAYSWEIPLTTQRSISAVAYTTYLMNKYPGIIPYQINAMMWYITAPYWNNAYTLTDLLQKVTETDSNGNYYIPFSISVDLFMQETNNVVDLIIPDLSFLEIYGFHSTFDRPTSLPQGPSDSLNWPALPAMYPVLSNGDFMLTLLWLVRGYPNQKANPNLSIDPTNNPHYTTQDPVTGLPLISPITLHDPVTGQTIFTQGQPGLISTGMYILKTGTLIAGYGSNFEYILTDEEGSQTPNPQQLKLYASFVPNGANQSDVINQILSQVPSGQTFSTANTYKISASNRSTGIEHYFRIPVKFQPLLQALLSTTISMYASNNMTLDEINPGIVKVGKGGAVYVLPPSIRYMRNVNMFYFRGWGAYMPGAYGSIGLPWIHRIYLEYLQKFRLAAAGKWKGYNAAYYYYYKLTGNSSLLVPSVVPNDSYGQALAKNILDYHKPFGGYYPPPTWQSEITTDGINLSEYPLTFFVRRHDRTYHSWSFNVPWLIAIMPYTPVMLSKADPYVQSMGIQSGDFVTFEAINEPYSGGLRTQLTAIAFLDEATRPGAAWVVVSAQALPGFRSQTENSPQVKYSILNNWANISYMPSSRFCTLSP
ncbi:MAG: oxidoreductase, partial [Saccharolobus sp.]